MESFAGSTPKEKRHAQPSDPRPAQHAGLVRRSERLSFATSAHDAKAFAEILASGDAATLPIAEGLGLLLDRESSYRNDKRLAARLRYAKLRHQAAVEDVDYRIVRNLDWALFQRLVAGDWIDAHDNIIFCGETGLGKSWLACALGHKACRDNRSVLYVRVPKLFDELALARGDGRHARLMKR